MKLHIYNLDDRPLEHPYAQVVSQTNGLVYNPTSQEMEPIADATFADTIIVLTSATIIGGWVLDLPLDIASGEYHLLIRDNETPNAADAIIDFARFAVSLNQLVVTPSKLGRVL